MKLTMVTILMIISGFVLNSTITKQSIKDNGHYCNTIVVDTIRKVVYDTLPYQPSIGKEVKKLSKDENYANDFSNLGFILNPNYAKKHKIPQRIVNIKAKKVEEYILRFGAVAVKEMHEYGIPASITLAQGLLESNVGESKLSVGNKNHFGIKCFSRNCKKGHCSNYTDDSHKDFFRKYDTDWESYRAHSLFLQKDRYKHLKKLGKNYKKWSHGLRKAGYATDPKYGQKLIGIIEALNLNRFDNK